VASNAWRSAPYSSTRFASLIAIGIANLADGPWRKTFAVAVQATHVGASEPTWVTGLRLQSWRSV
jgi:hypothetical protein